MCAGGPPEATGNDRPRPWGGPHGAAPPWGGAGRRPSRDQFLDDVGLLHADQDAILKKFGKRETTDLLVEITEARNDLELKLD